MNNVYIIGCGGVGSWLTPAMCLLVGDPSNIIVVDGDKLEQKNLNRQLFTNDDIGRFKAEALAEKYGCQGINRYFSSGMLEIDRGDWILCAVDNNLGRAEALKTCDETGCQAIFGCNEVTSAEAYFYASAWKSKDSDPRVYYPNIKTDKSNDPRAAAIGCTGEAQIANVQLVSANFMAAALMQHLYVIWAMERRKIKGEAVMYLPHRLRQNLTKYETVNGKDLCQK
jgi:ThiF family